MGVNLAVAWIWHQKEEEVPKRREDDLVDGKTPKNGLRSKINATERKMLTSQLVAKKNHG